MNILYIGSNSWLSIKPLLKLLENNHTVSAIASDEVNIDNKINGISIFNDNNKSINNIANKKNIRFITLRNDYNKSIRELYSLDIDLIIIACYARKVPQSILSLAKIGCVNLHPSLLPKYRGPTPLFWMFRDGVKNLSVTIHHVSNEYDKGGIIRQDSVSKEDGIDLKQADFIVSDLAANLLIDFLIDPAENIINRVKQDELESSYQSFPSLKDYSINLGWSAQHMYNFICALKSKTNNFPCLIDGIRFFIKSAVSFDMCSTINSSYEIDGDILTISCATGIIKCTLDKAP